MLCILDPLYDLSSRTPSRFLTRRLGDCKDLHYHAFELAVTHMGQSHAFTSLARCNLVEAMDELGLRKEARCVRTLVEEKYNEGGGA